MALPFLSQRTPRESPTLATVSSLSDRRATRHVVPGSNGDNGETERVRCPMGADEVWESCDISDSLVKYDNL